MNWSLVTVSVLDCYWTFSYDYSPYSDQVFYEGTDIPSVSC